MKWVQVGFNIAVSAALLVFFVVATVKEMRATHVRCEPSPDARWTR